MAAETWTPARDGSGTGWDDRATKWDDGDTVWDPEADYPEPWTPAQD